MTHDYAPDAMDFLAGRIIETRRMIEKCKNEKRAVTQRQNEAEAALATLEARFSKAMEENGILSGEFYGYKLALRINKPKLIVTDPDKLPDTLCRIERKPDMAKINDAFDRGERVEGVTLDNGSQSLVITGV